MKMKVREFLVSDEFDEFWTILVCLFLVLFFLAASGCSESHEKMPTEACIKQCVIQHIEAMNAIDELQISPELYAEIAAFCFAVHQNRPCEDDFKPDFTASSE